MSNIVMSRARAWAIAPHVGPDLGATERWVSGFTGGALIAGALLRRDAWAIPLLAAGGYGVYRGIVGRCPMTRALGLGRGIGSRTEPVSMRTSITISESPDVLFERWR